MTGSATDSEGWQGHSRNKARRENLSGRFEDAANRFKLVSVSDTSLIGFEVPDLTTMYIDTPVVTNMVNGSYAYGTVKPTDYSPKTAAHLYATILRGHDYLKALGTVPPFVFVRWTPGDGLTTGYVHAANAIFVMGGYSYITNPLRPWPDEWDDGVVMHEYGHHLGHAFNYQAIPPGPYSHSPDTVSTSNGVPSRVTFPPKAGAV